MARCEVCGNDYDKSCEVTAAGQSHENGRQDHRDHQEGAGGRAQRQEGAGQR
jgi:hypothetical protein